MPGDVMSFEVELPAETPVAMEEGLEGGCTVGSGTVTKVLH